MVVTGGLYVRTPRISRFLSLRNDHNLTTNLSTEVRASSRIAFSYQPHRFVGHPQRVASTISAFVELKVFADQTAADAFGTIRKWLGIHSRFLHDFHFGFQSCNELLGLSVIFSCVGKQSEGNWLSRKYAIKEDHSVNEGETSGTAKLWPF